MPDSSLLSAEEGLILYQVWRVFGITGPGDKCHTWTWTAIPHQDEAQGLKNRLVPHSRLQPIGLRGGNRKSYNVKIQDILIFHKFSHVPKYQDFSV